MCSNVSNFRQRIQVLFITFFFNSFGASSPDPPDLNFNKICSSILTCFLKFLRYKQIVCPFFFVFFPLNINDKLCLNMSNFCQRIQFLFFFLQQLGGKAPRPPSPLIEILAKKSFFVEHQNQIGEKR